MFHGALVIGGVNVLKRKFTYFWNIAAILVISMHPEFELIQRSIRSDIDGFMQKDEIDDYLVEAIRRVHQGERYLSPKAREVYNSIQE